CIRNSVCNLVRSRAQWIGLQMRITFGYANLGMPQQFSDYVKRLSASDPKTGKRMTQIVDAQFPQSRCRPHATPIFMQSHVVGRSPPGGQHEFGLSWKPGEDLKRGGCERNYLRSGFAIREPKAATLEINIGPLKGQDFGLAASSK